MYHLYISLLCILPKGKRESSLELPKFFHFLSICLPVWQKRSERTLTLPSEEIALRLPKLPVLRWKAARRPLTHPNPMALFPPFGAGFLKQSSKLVCSVKWNGFLVSLPWHKRTSMEGPRTGVSGETESRHVECVQTHILLAQLGPPCAALCVCRRRRTLVPATSSAASALVSPASCFPDTDWLQDRRGWRDGSGR